MTPQTLARLVVVVVVVVASCVFFLPARASAQAETGNIAGVVRDTSGAILPGVTVEAASPALIEKVRVVVTDDQGLYRIVDLRPGTYTVTFTLPGFSTFRRDGVELTTAFTATVNGEMRVGTVEETITVTGTAPVVDVQNVGQQTTVTRDLLDAIPNSRRPSQLISLILGADAGGANFHDVGGVGTDRGFFGVHGQRAEDMTFNFGGMDSRVFSGGGFQYNVHTYQEVVVETTAGSAESTTGGVQINIIPRDGGNVFSGSMSSEFTSPKLSSDNVDDDLRQRGLNKAPSVREYYDVGGGFGGPIQRDTLWFFASARWEDLPGGQLLQQAAGVTLLRTRPQSPGVQPRLLEGHRLAPHLADRATAQDRGVAHRSPRMSVRLRDPGADQPRAGAGSRGGTPLQPAEPLCRKLHVSGDQPGIARVRHVTESVLPEPEAASGRHA
jgi:hypothetical protein